MKTYLPGIYKYVLVVKSARFGEKAYAGHIQITAPAEHRAMVNAVHDVERQRNDREPVLYASDGQYDARFKRAS